MMNPPKMPSIQFLALWTVVSELQTADLEAFSRWLWSAQSGAADCVKLFAGTSRIARIGCALTRWWAATSPKLRSRVPKTVLFGMIYGFKREAALMSRKSVPKQRPIDVALATVTINVRRAPRFIGYARVSTDAQTTALQRDALNAAGCDRLFEEKESGARRSRPQLDKALEYLDRGDTLVVWKLDRLGRSLRDLLDAAEVLRERGIALRSLTEHIDTSTAAGKMLYAILGAVAQFERDVLRERTVAGIRAAKARGERIGRPPALTPSQIREAKAMMARGDSPSHVARILRIGRSTLYRALSA